MKLFSFTNNFLSDIQKGIQTAHLVVEMAVEYLPRRSKLFVEWYRFHKTIVVFNGGNHRDLMELYKFFKKIGKYPFGFFNEDNESLRGAFTAVGIVLPDPFASREQRDSMDILSIEGNEKKLIEILNNSRLA